MRRINNGAVARASAHWQLSGIWGGKTGNGYKKTNTPPSRSKKHGHKKGRS